MNFINKNIKNIGMINVVLTILIMIVEILAIFDGEATNVDRVFYIAIIVSLVAGLFYSFSFYKKGAANFYKFFIIVYALTAIDSVVVHTIGLLNNNPRFNFDIMYIANIISMICVCLLAFVPNLGKKKSYALVLTNLSLSVLLFVYELAGFGLNLQLPATVYGIFILSWMNVVFIAGKYADKDARGAK